MSEHRYFICDICGLRVDDELPADWKEIEEYEEVSPGVLKALGEVERGERAPFMLGLEDRMRLDHLMFRRRHYCPAHRDRAVDAHVNMVITED